MSTTTLKLPFKRFVAQVSSAPARSKSSYLALMAENLEALKKCPWREAAAVPVSLTGHDFTASTQFSDAFDAFKLTGNYETATMTEIAYAGMAAYRFKIPESAKTGSVPVASVSLPVSRDRFLKDGLHVAAAFSASAEPSADWETIRGSGALAASSVLAQSAATLMEGSADATTVTLDLSGVSSGNPAAYLWVYVTLEDYTDRWTMYNAKEKRLYAIEGSAMLAGGSAEVTFGDAVTADSDGAEARYRTTPIPVRVCHWMYPSMPKLHFRTLHKLGYGNWKHLVPTGEWEIPAGASDFPICGELDTVGRRIPSGDCILECWSGDGQFVPGMPYGCVYIHASSSERADITLTRTNPNIVRIDLAAAIQANNSFDAATAATDRSKFNSMLGYGTNEALPSGTEVDLSSFNSNTLTHVRVVRCGLNGTPCSSSSADVLIDTFFDLSVRSVMTEADIPLSQPVSGFSFIRSLDAGTLNRAFNGSATPSMSLETAEYRIVIGDGDVATDQSQCYDNNLQLVFKNVFEALTAQTPTTPDESLSGMSYSGYPTIRWTHVNTVNKAYPEFRVRFYASNANDASVVYDSGPLPAPTRDEAGMYEWTAPVKSGDTTGKGVTLATGTTYYWAVSMLDAKFTGFNSNETRTPFTFAAAAN